MRDGSRGASRLSRPGWIAVAAVIVAVGVLTSFLLLAQPIRPGVGYTVPPYLWMDNQTRVLAGSAGCLPRSGELCYGFQAGVEASGFRLSDVRFEFTNDSGGTTSGPSAPERPLGPSASVLVLNTSGAPVAQWNWTDHDWEYGAAWALPVGGSFSLVFDTGFTNENEVVGAMFTLTTTAPIEGSVGASLVIPPF